VLKTCLADRTCSEYRVPVRTRQSQPDEMILLLSLPHDEELTADRLLARQPRLHVRHAAIVGRRRRPDSTSRRVFGFSDRAPPLHARNEIDDARSPSSGDRVPTTSSVDRDIVEHRQHVIGPRASRGSSPKNSEEACSGARGP